MKNTKLFSIFLVVILSINSFAGVVSKERGINYYYGEDNNKKCKNCKGTGITKEKAYIVNRDKTLTEYGSRITKCPICKGTKKQRRIIDFRKIILPKSKKIYKMCSITKFAFPLITIKHLNGNTIIHIKYLPKSIIKIIASWIQMDMQNNYYIMHNAQMPGVIGGLIGAFQEDYFLKTYLKGFQRIKIKKDKKNQFYFYQMHCREYWGSRHINNKYVVIKTNLINFDNIITKLKDQKLMYIRIKKVLKKISAAEMKKMQWTDTENGKIAAQKAEVNAEVLLKPDIKTVYKVLKGELPVQEKFTNSKKNNTP